MDTSGSLVMLLSSDANISTHPDNQQSDFVVSLAHEITLDGSWTVSLSQLYYPLPFNGALPETHVYYTLVWSMSTSLQDAPKQKITELCLRTFDKPKDDQYQIEILGELPVTGVIENERSQYKTFYGSVTLKPKSHVSTQKLGDELAELIEADVNRRQVEELKNYVKNFGKLRVFFQSEKSPFNRFRNLLCNQGVVFAYVLGSPLLAQILGLNYEKVVFKGYKLSQRDYVAKEHLQTFVKPTFYALLNGTPKKCLTVENAMYLYADVVDLQNVNDMLLPLLAVIPVRSVGFYEPARLTPKRVCRSVINRIHISIRTSKGELFPFFNDSTTVCTIRFDRTNALLYKTVRPYQELVVSDNEPKRSDDVASKQFVAQ